MSKTKHNIIILLSSAILSTLLGTVCIIVNFPNISPVRFWMCIGVIIAYDVLMLSLIALVVSDRK